MLEDTRLAFCALAGEGHAVRLNDLEEAWACWISCRTQEVLGVEDTPENRMAFERAWHARKAIGWNSNRG